MRAAARQVAAGAAPRARDHAAGMTDRELMIELEAACAAPGTRGRCASAASTARSSTARCWPARTPRCARTRTRRSAGRARRRRSAAARAAAASSPASRSASTSSARATATSPTRPGRSPIDGLIRRSTARSQTCEAILDGIEELLVPGTSLGAPVPLRPGDRGGGRVRRRLDGQRPGTRALRGARRGARDQRAAVPGPRRHATAGGRQRDRDRAEARAARRRRGRPREHVPRAADGGPAENLTPDPA